MGTEGFYNNEKPQHPSLIADLFGLTLGVAVFAVAFIRHLRKV